MNLTLIFKSYILHTLHTLHPVYITYVRKGTVDLNLNVNFEFNRLHPFKNVEFEFENKIPHF